MDKRCNNPLRNRYKHISEKMFVIEGFIGLVLFVHTINSIPAHIREMDVAKAILHQPYRLNWANKKMSRFLGRTSYYT